LQAAYGFQTNMMRTRKSWTGKRWWIAPDQFSWKRAGSRPYGCGRKREHLLFHTRQIIGAKKSNLLLPQTLTTSLQPSIWSDGYVIYVPFRLIRYWANTETKLDCFTQIKHLTAQTLVTVLTLLHIISLLSLCEELEIDIAILDHRRLDNPIQASFASLCA